MNERLERLAVEGERGQEGKEGEVAHNPGTRVERNMRGRLVRVSGLTHGGGGRLLAHPRHVIGRPGYFACSTIDPPLMFVAALESSS